MSNVVIGGTATGATALPVASTIDGVQDYIPIYTNSATATQAINRNTFLGLGSAPVGLTDTQTLTNKVLTAPTISSPTLSGTTAGTFTLGGTITFPASVVQLTSSQTLTNKVLTSPTINSPTITNATLSADTITGFTTGTTGTIYGIAVTSSTLSSAAYAAGSVNTAALASASVTPTKLSTGAASATVATLQTTSTTWGDLSTAGPSITLTVGANGLVLIGISANMSNSVQFDYAEASFVASGTNTIAVGTQPYQLTFAAPNANGTGQVGNSWLITGLTAGSTTFKMQYQNAVGGTASFSNRHIWGLPL